MRRFLLSLATVLVVGSVVSSAAVASANTIGHTKPVITSTQVTFTIPSTPVGEWRLTLTSYPPPVTRLGRVIGTSGTLTLPVPTTSNCEFQADVKILVNGMWVMYSSAKATFTTCGPPPGTGTRFTPGYWKNHEAATTALLPQTLGGYTVSTFAQAQAIFDAMKCNDGVNCLAGHLLAAQLDVANGSSTCIAGTIADANNLLAGVPYTGPGSYGMNAQAVSLAAMLDKYTNDSNSTTC